MIPFLFPFSRGLLFPLVALDKIYVTFMCMWVRVCVCIDENMYVYLHLYVDVTA